MKFHAFTNALTTLAAINPTKRKTAGNMNVLYAFLITLVVYPILGTLLFALVENLKTSIKLKVLILTFGHPLLSGIFIWLVCSTFNREIAEIGVLFVAGTFLRIPFSDRKYFSNLIRESGVVTIEYVTELLKRRTVQIIISEVKDFRQSKSRHLIDKLSELTVTLPTEILTFKILDKNEEALLT
ncbi:hypothetical protein [Terrimonas alba]|uniref:hypothetical protein n=1 Tax=Terrimonas alba TaxID=3349636 RepID=UPI0035F43F3E